MTGTTYAKAAITGRSRGEVLRRLHAEQRAGRIHSAGNELTLITHGPHAGEYAVPVLLIANPRPGSPRWARVCIAVGGVLLALAVVVGLLAWLVTSLSGPALVACCVAAVAGLALRVRRAHPRVRVTTTTTVEIR